LTTKQMVELCTYIVRSKIKKIERVV